VLQDLRCEPPLRLLNLGTKQWLGPLATLIQLSSWSEGR
jgi:hypothetical protein